MVLAVVQGRLDILKHLRFGLDPAPWGQDVTNAAASYMECLWLILQEPSCPTSPCLVTLVAATRDLNALKRLCAASDCPSSSHWDAIVCLATAECGNLAMLQWMRSCDPPAPWDKSVRRQAAKRGNMRMQQWAWAQDVPAPWSEHCSAAAAGASHIPMLEWMCAQDPPCPLSNMAINEAADCGRLEVLSWLRSKSLPWGKRFTVAAACSRNLATLKRILAQDPACPLSPNKP